MPGAVLITPPALEPVSLVEAQHQVGASEVDDAAALQAWIAAAREAAELYTGRQFMTATWELRLDEFNGRTIRLPRPRLLSVLSVKYDDAAGAEQTLATSEYQVDGTSEPGLVLLRDGKSWPDTFPQANAVRIRYTAGFGPGVNDVPAPIRAAIRLRVDHLFSNRGSVLIGTISKELEHGERALLDPYRIVEFY